MRQFPIALVLRSLAVAVLPLLTASTSQAQKLPTDLEAVPRQAAGFLHFRAADLYHSEPFADLRHLVDRAGAQALKTFISKSPIDPSTIDRLTLVFLDLVEPFPRVDPEAKSAIVIVRTSKPFDRLRILQALGARDKIYRRSLYHFHEELWSGMLLLDERTLLIGAEDSIVQYFDMLRASDASGPLQAALATAAAGQHHVVLGVNPAALGKTMPVIPPELQALFQAHCGAALLNVGKELKLEVRLDYAKADTAAEGEKAVRALLELARQALILPIMQLENLLNKDADKVDASTVAENFMCVLGLGYLREMDNLLAKAPIQRDGTVVRMPLAYNRPEAASFTAMLAAISFVGTSASTTFRTIGQSFGEVNENPYEKHLKTLYQALEKHHAEKGSYPPPALVDADGRPILSWRVALLPYLGDDAKALHAEFRLDEPWDSLHNKRLIKRMPQAFQMIEDYYYDGRQWQTADVVFVGPGAAFQAKQGRKKADLRPDAALLVHAAYLPKRIYWSKPADIQYAPNSPLPKLYDQPFRAEGDFSVLLANGTFRSVKSNMPDEELRKLIEGNK